jgi:hypothetical protein
MNEHPVRSTMRTLSVCGAMPIAGSTMATPYVAGLAALLIGHGQDSDQTNADVRATIEGTWIPSSALGPSGVMGAPPPAAPLVGALRRMARCTSRPSTCRPPGRETTARPAPMSPSWAKAPLLSPVPRPTSQRRCPMVLQPNSMGLAERRFEL